VSVVGRTAASSRVNEVWAENNKHAPIANSDMASVERLSAGAKRRTSTLGGFVVNGRADDSDQGHATSSAPGEGLGRRKSASASTEAASVPGRVLGDDPVDLGACRTA